jgi:two-component system response regulator YesN
LAYNVVIIDDESWTREVVRSLGKWDEYGLQVVGEASDGECGLELIRQVKPEIVITDIHMPHLNGLDLIRKLREDAYDAFVIFISGYDEFEYARSAVSLGASSYILKPIKEKELNDQLIKCKDALSRRKEKETEQLFFVGNFINATWANDFYTLRNEINETFRAQQKNILKNKFYEVNNLIMNDKRKDSVVTQEQMVGIYYTLTNILNRYINSCGYTIGEIFGETNTSFVFGKQSTLEILLLFVYELYSIAIDKLEELQLNKNKLDIDRIAKYIDENYCNGITLEETASRFYVSKEYLSKLFKLRMGDGFSEYVTAKRMEKAKELICDLKLPLKEVSEMVGYIDLAHFYKTFKKYFGKTPGTMRDELNIYNKTSLE